MDARHHEDLDSSRRSPQSGSASHALRQRAIEHARECFENARSAEIPNGILPQPEDLERVSRCIGAFARALRDEGALPEQMIVAVKELIAEAAPPSVARNALFQHGVPWAIRAFYTDD